MEKNETLIKGFDFAKERYEYFLFALVVVLFLLTRLANFKGFPIHIDEAVYAHWGQGAMLGEKWIALIDGKPPLHPWAMIPFLKVFSDPLVAARMLSVFCGAASLVGIILIGREFRDWKLAAWVGLFWVLCPFVLWYDRLAFTEGMLVALIIWAVFFAVKAARSDNYLFLIGTGIFTGLSLLTKATGQLLYLVIPFAYVLRGRPEVQGEKGPTENDTDATGAKKLPLLKWIISVALALLVGYGMYNMLRIAPTFNMIGQRALVISRTYGDILRHPFSYTSVNLHSIYNTLWARVTPLLLILCVLGILLGLLKSWRPAYFCLIWFLITLAIIATTAKHPFDRYWMVLLPPLILGAGYAIAELPSMVLRMAGKAKQAGAKKALTALIAIAVVVYLVLMAFPIEKNLADPIFHPEKVGLTQQSWGWGYDEVVRTIKEKSKKRLVNVWVYDYFSDLVMTIYLKDIPNVEIVREQYAPRVIPPNVIAKINSGNPTYFVGNNAWRVPQNPPTADLKIYPKDGSKRIQMIFTRIVAPP